MRHAGYPDQQCPFPSGPLEYPQDSSGLQTGRGLLLRGYSPQPDPSREVSRPDGTPAKEAGGYADKVGENKWTLHPIVFKDRNAPGYQSILAMPEEGKRRLEEVSRFDMPNFKPHPAPIREMGRYGVLSPGFDLEKDRVDVYKPDACCWRDKRYVPDRDTRPHLLRPCEKREALKRRQGVADNRKGLSPVGRDLFRFASPCTGEGCPSFSGTSRFRMFVYLSKAFSAAKRIST